MKKDDYIKYWMNSSEKDFITMENLFNSKDYSWSLFMGHLVLEKLFKALYIKKRAGTSQTPKTHDLLLLSQKAGAETDDKKKDLLDLITTFNISARYPDYKNSFYNKCTKEYTNDKIKDIKELRKWLITIIESK